MNSETQNYDPNFIEAKWQRKWEQDGLYQANVDPGKQKYYALTMLPYPSGELHIGHWYAMTPSDARARYMRMKGFNVMFPMGFDAFGLPAENAAIKNAIHPKNWTYRNIDKMREQLRSMGTMFDWRREAISADPKYYRWTQWFFVQFFKNGIAYRKKSPVDWCPNCNTTLAREQVWGDDRHCERCGTPVIKKDLDQWFFRSTNYAEELLDFSTIDWPDRVRLLQENWIGRSEGASVTFTTEDGLPLEVFTTRPDTLWGATFMVLAPEHPLVDTITTPEHGDEVKAYKLETSRMTEIQREAADNEKTGIFTGGYAINPVNQEKIPVWIADYVLMTYGTGAIMAVPAHDERDFEFALKFGISILPVIENPSGVSKSFVLGESMEPGFLESLGANEILFTENQDNNICVEIHDRQIDKYIECVKSSIRDGFWVEVIGKDWVFIFKDETIYWDSTQSEEKILKRCKLLEPDMGNNATLMEMLWGNQYYRDALFHHDYGKMINSGEFSGTEGDRAKENVTNWLTEKGIGKKMINYRLRDWLISRQRYWGSPIPMVLCQSCGWLPVPEDQLPILLPDDVEWTPTGKSPLKLHPTWKLTQCPDCGEQAVRETDTMDTFMCSSWYHLRYLSPDFINGPFDQNEYDYWMPVDIYTGGIEHATMHLIYTRFFHKACRDLGITEGPEPMTRLRNQGMVLGEDHEKMSKSRGNVIAPDDLVSRYGADTVRAYLMFFARWELGGPWNSNGIEGTTRWLKRVWTLVHEKDIKGTPSKDVLRSLRRKVHLTLQQITDDFDRFEFNTIISSLMELMNEMVKARDAGAVGTPEWNEAIDIYLRMLAPVTPHISEELWAHLGKPYSIHQQEWPQVDTEAVKVDEITIVLQVNGKVRDRLLVPIDIQEDEIRILAFESETMRRHIGDDEPKKVIYIPGKLLNIVV